jgi:hypothetical protein
MCCGLSSVCQSCRRRQRCRPACLYYWLSLVVVSSCVVAVGSGVIVFVKVVVVLLCATGSHWFRCHRVWDNTSEPAVFNLKVRSSMLSSHACLLQTTNSRHSLSFFIVIWSLFVHFQSLRRGQILCLSHTLPYGRTFTLEIDSCHRLWMVEEVSLIAWLDASLLFNNQSVALRYVSENVAVPFDAIGRAA